jgi:lysophospholipase L1-like esterase
MGVVKTLFSVIISFELMSGTRSERKWVRTKSLNILRNYRQDLKLPENQLKELSKGLYSRDQFGLRGDYGVPQDIRILTMGGSTTNQKYIPDGFTYQDILQAKLSTHFGKPIKVANAGVEGHSSFAHLESLKIWFPLIPEMNPNYIFLYIGINDAGFRDQTNLNHDFLAHGNRIWELKRFLRNYSKFYAFLRKIRNTLLPGKKSPLYASHAESLPFQFQYQVKELTLNIEEHILKNTEYFEKRLRLILIEIKKLGATPVLISQPHLYVQFFDGIEFGLSNVFHYQGIEYSGLDYNVSLDSLSTVMINLCNEFDFLFIDIKNKKFAKSDFYDCVHMTKQGVRRVGEYIFDEFIKLNIKF